jgi:hypothetical protein
MLELAGRIADGVKEGAAISEELVIRFFAALGLALRQRSEPSRSRRTIALPLVRPK